MEYSYESFNVVEATARLLTDDSWRRRVVEQIRPLTTDHYELRRSFQFEIPWALLQDLEEDGAVNAFLPICWLPKRPLLSFDVVNTANISQPILDRATNAFVLTEILTAWQHQICGDDVEDQLSEEDLMSICRISLDPWLQARNRAGSDETKNVLASYYTQTIGLSLSYSECDALLRSSMDAMTRFAAPADGTRDVLVDSTVNAAVAAPFVEPAQTVDNLERLVAMRNSRLLSTGDRMARTNPGLEWIKMVARAGIDWPVLVPISLRPGFPILIKTREVRVSGHKKARRFVHCADLSAAESYHLEVQTPEPAIRLKAEPTMTDGIGRPIGPPEEFDSAVWTNELFTTYTSRIDRPERPATAIVRVSYALYLATYTSDLFALILILSGLAITLIFAGSVNAGFAALVLIPTTVVSAFIAVRESVLVSTFLKPLRLLVLASNITLWFMVLITVGLSNT